jgi:nucleotide-binding universal stress UspA family protein
MLSIRTVLYPTDFSECSEFAFRLACSLARDYAARLVVLHVAEPTMALAGEGVLLFPPEADLKVLREKLEQLRPRDPKIAVEYSLVEGDAAAAILQVAQETRCDVIVLGTHGRTGVSRLLIGSVAEQVVRRAPCPVATAKAFVPETTPPTPARTGTTGGLVGVAKG